MDSTACIIEQRATEQGSDEDSGESAEPAAEHPTLQIELTFHEAVDPSCIDPPLEGWFEQSLATLARAAGVTAGSVVVTVVSDDDMSRLHEQYKGVAGTTDVLSFDLIQECMPMEDRGGVVDVDLVVCVDEARRQATSRGHEVRLELLLYALHGVLHVLGYDDTDEQAAQRMHRREDELLSQSGFGTVYGSSNH